MLSQKLMVNFEVVKGERKYLFFMEMNSPLGECYDVCHEVLMEIMEQAKKAAEKAKQNNESVNPEVQ